jgi:hypothetical protein
LASIASSSPTVSRRTPEAPTPKLASLSAIFRRMTGVGEARPVPAAWLSTMLRCRIDSSSSAIRTLASFPKPVLMP